MAYGFELGKNMVPVQEQHERRAVVLNASGWTASGGTFYQDASVQGVTDGNTIIVSAAPASLDAYAAAGVYAAQQSAGTIRFRAATRPTANLTVNVVILEV